MRYGGLTPDDRWAIAETLASHGHLFDEGQFDRLDELFTADVVYDLSDLGTAPLHGIEETRRITLELGTANPLAHHVTNVVITGSDGVTATTRSKAVAVMADGRAASATYIDTLRREGGRWRISRRVVLARRSPLNLPA